MIRIVPASIALEMMLKDDFCKGKGKLPSPSMLIDRLEEPSYLEV